MLFQTWALILTGQLPYAEQRLQTVEQLFQQMDAEQQARFRPPLGRVAVIRATAAATTGQDATYTIDLSQQALSLIAEYDASMRSILHLNLGNAYLMQGDLTAAAQAYSSAISQSEMAPISYFPPVAYSYLAKLRLIQGQINEADQLDQQALQASPYPARQALNDGVAHVGLAELLYEWNDIEAAMSHVSLGLELLDRPSQDTALLIGEQINGYTLLGRLRRLQSNIEGAQDAFQKSQHLQQLAPPRHSRKGMSWAVRYQTRYWIASDDTMALRDWLTAYPLNDGQHGYGDTVLGLAHVRALRAE